MNQILLGILLGLFELALQLLQSGLIRLHTLPALDLQRQERLIYLSHRFGFGLVVFCADGSGSLERHVLEQVRKARDPPDLIDRTDIGVGVK